MSDFESNSSFCKIDKDSLAYLSMTSFPCDWGLVVVAAVESFVVDVKFLDKLNPENFLLKFSKFDAIGSDNAGCG